MNIQELLTTPASKLTRKQRKERAAIKRQAAKELGIGPGRSLGRFRLPYPPTDSSGVASRLVEQAVVDGRFARDRRRKQREAARVLRGLPPVPGWIDEDPPRFDFPYWAPQWRPFDWAEDFGRWRDTTITAQVIEAARITAPVLSAEVVNAFSE